MRERTLRRVARRLLPTAVHQSLTEAITLRRLEALERTAHNHAVALARLRHPEFGAIEDLVEAELKIDSQHGEDGVLLWLFSKIGTTDSRFVEFGVEDGRECNTANLSRHWGWSGLLLEADAELATAAAEYYSHRPVVVQQTMVTPDNIGTILAENGFDGEFDLLSIDIDGYDYWVWDAITARPRVVVIEYNPSLGPHRSATVPFDPDFAYDQYTHGGAFHGASITALTKLGSKKGYSLIGCESSGANAFLVRNDCLNGLTPALPEVAWRPSLVRQGSIEEQMNRLTTLPFVDV